MSAQGSAAARRAAYGDASAGASAPLASVFLSNVAETVRRSLEEEEDLELVLVELVRSARAVWPPFVVSDQLFIGFLAERFGQPDKPRAALLNLRVDDLLLACACAASDLLALDAFRKKFDPEIAKAVRRCGPCSEAIDDVQQIVYEKLFVGGPDIVPKITQYRGRGSLLNWVRVVVVRVVQNLHRGCGRRPAVEPDTVLAFANAACGVPDPELAYLKLRYGDALRDALRVAVESLPPSERTILRYRYREGLPVETIARIHRAHRTTMTRRLATIRRHLRTQTLAILGASLGGSPSEVSSILHLLSSQLDVTLASVQLWGEDW